MFGLNKYFKNESSLKKVPPVLEEGKGVIGKNSLKSEEIKESNSLPVEEKEKNTEEPENFSKN